MKRLICKDCNDPLEDCTCTEDTIDMKPETKQETLEEAAERYTEEHKWEEQDPWFDFMEGARWQQERSYSEEEVIAFGEFIFKHSLLTHTRGVKSLFEQFKNR